MQSNGGLTTAEAAAATPMHIIESGRRPGWSACRLARRIGIDKAISFDMGGTTAKASLIENGDFTRAAEYQEELASCSARGCCRGPAIR